MLISDLSSTQMMLLVLPILPNMWALKHAFHHDFPTEKEKFRWMMACVFLPCIGGLAYIFVGRKHASKEKIDVFERYGKDKKEAAPEAVPAESAAVVPVQEQPVVDDPDCPLEYESRARAPWDEEPAEAVEAGNTASAESPRPEVKNWDFGCPDDVRKN